MQGTGRAFAPMVAVLEVISIANPPQHGELEFVERASETHEASSTPRCIESNGRWRALLGRVIAATTLAAAAHASISPRTDAIKLSMVARLPSRQCVRQP